MHTVTDKTRLLQRVRRIQGQAAALERQLAADGDCGEILQQIAAIRGAVNGLMAAVLTGHLVDHVVHEPQQAEREREMAPILRLVRSYLA